MKVPDNQHCVKSVRISSFSVPYFPTFGLNKDQKNSEYGHFSHSANITVWAVNPASYLQLYAVDHQPVKIHKTLEEISLKSEHFASHTIIFDYSILFKLLLKLRIHQI